MNGKRVLLTFAHPDDETFGPGGTIVKWATQGAHIKLICATRGEVGMNHTGEDTGSVRERELRASADILGIREIEFLGYIDGSMCNEFIPKLELTITEKIQEFKPDVILTFDLNGSTGHLDHVAIANATTSAFDKTHIAEKLYYYALPAGFTSLMHNYFIHFPKGRTLEEIDETVDISNVWEDKLRAMYCHETQKYDSEIILTNWRRYGKQEDYFVIRTWDNEHE